MAGKKKKAKSTSPTGFRKTNVRVGGKTAYVKRAARKRRKAKIIPPGPYRASRYRAN